MKSGTTSGLILANSSLRNQFRNKRNRFTLQDQAVWQSDYSWRVDINNASVDSERNHQNGVPSQFMWSAASCRRSSVCKRRPQHLHKHESPPFDPRENRRLVFNSLVSPPSHFLLFCAFFPNFHANSASSLVQLASTGVRRHRRCPAS